MPKIPSLEIRGTHLAIESVQNKVEHPPKTQNQYQTPKHEIQKLDPKLHSQHSNSLTQLPPPQTGNLSPRPPARPPAQATKRQILLHMELTNSTRPTETLYYRPCRWGRRPAPRSTRPPGRRTGPNSCGGNGGMQVRWLPP
jgi:hypothetical protein